MSETTDLRERLRTRLEQVRVRLRDLELDATLVRGRTEEAREDEAALMELLDDTPRRRPGRPRVASALNTVPSHGELKQAMNIVPQSVEGGMASAEAGLPSLDDVRGILRTPDSGEAA